MSGNSENTRQSAARKRNKEHANTLAALAEKYRAITGERLRGIEDRGKLIAAVDNAAAYACAVYLYAAAQGKVRGEMPGYPYQALAEALLRSFMGALINGGITGQEAKKAARDMLAQAFEYAEKSL